MENWLRIRLRSLLVYVVKFKFLIDKYLDETTQINSRLSEYSFENVFNLLVVSIAINYFNTFLAFK